MKKTIIALTLGIAALALPAAAQNQNSAPKSCTKSATECVSKENCNKSGKDCKDCGRKDHKKGHKIHKKGMSPMLKGIELTADQQSQMAKLRQEAKDAGKKVAEKSREEKAKIRKDFMNKMEKVLTPEQLAKFKENCKNMEEVKAKGPKNGQHMKNHPKSGDKPGHQKFGKKGAACNAAECKTKENKK